MRIRKEELCEKSEYLLKRKEMKNVPWSFGSCHACWKKIRRNFSDERKTPHPYQSNIDDPNFVGVRRVRLCYLQQMRHGDGEVFDRQG
jgi:hypothetical protein